MYLLLMPQMIVPRADIFNEAAASRHINERREMAFYDLNEGGPTPLPKTQRQCTLFRRRGVSPEGCTVLKSIYTKTRP